MKQAQQAQQQQDMAAALLAASQQQAQQAQQHFMLASLAAGAGFDGNAMHQVNCVLLGCGMSNLLELALPERSWPKMRIQPF